MLQNGTYWSASVAHHPLNNGPVVLTTAKGPRLERGHMELPADRTDDDLHYVFENRVRFAETDAQGVVYYGEYVTFQDETFNAFLRDLGYPYGEFEDAGIDFHVVHTEVDYLAQAGFEDALANGIRVESIGESSVHFAWACRRRAGDAVVATGGLSHVAVDASTGDPTRVPDGFRETVRAYQDEPPDGV